MSKELVFAFLQIFPIKLRPLPVVSPCKIPWASLVASGKEPACQCKRHRFDPWVGNIPWRRKQQPTPVFLPREFHGQKSLAGYSPWGAKSQTGLVTKQQ